MFKIKIITRNGHEIIVREPKSSDLKEFLRYINKQVKDKTEGIAINKPLTMKEERTWLKDLLSDIRNKKKIFLAFECNGKIIGSYEIRRRDGRMSHTASFGIAIEKEYRGQGIATQTIPILISLAKKKMKGLKIIDLEVFAYNKFAQKVYRNLGFKKVATIPNGCMNNGKLYDKYLMYYYLK